jgi:hypothetical protein
MSRGVLAVLAGLLFTCGLVYGLDALLMRLLPDEFNERHPAYLTGLLTFDVMVFVMAGAITALLARRAEVSLSLTTGVLTLLAGIPGGMHLYDGLPVWWHAMVLMLAIPATLLGGAVIAIARLPREA